MRCTSCKSGNLNPSYVDELFRAHTCDNCGGNWILIEDYISWKESHPDHEFADVNVEELGETGNALLVPDDGYHYAQNAYFKR